MSKQVKKQLPRETGEKISLGTETVGILDLPSLPLGKRLNCPSNTTVAEVIKFLSDTLNFDKQFIMPSSQFNPLDNVELLLPYKSKVVKEETKQIE